MRAKSIAIAFGGLTATYHHYLSKQAQRHFGLTIISMLIRFILSMRLISQSLALLAEMPTDTARAALFILLNSGAA